MMCSAYWLGIAAISVNLLSAGLVPVWGGETEATGRAVRMAITVRAEEGRQSGLTLPAGGGVPFACGQLKDANILGLFRVGAADPLPSQMRIASRWSDGSMKWLFVDTVAALEDGERLELRSQAEARPFAGKESLKVKADAGEAIEVDTGPLVFRVRRDIFNVLDQVWLRKGGEKQLIADGAGRGVIVLNSAHEEFLSSRDRQEYSVEVEENGPLKVVIRCQGRCLDARGRAIMNAVVRLTAWAGLPYVKATLTTIFTGDPDRDFIKGIGVEAPLLPAGERNASFRLDHEWKVTPIPQARKDGLLYVCQRDGVAAVLNRYWGPGNRLTDYGCKASGLADLTAADHGLTVYQRKFDREWPCEISMDVSRNAIVAWPFASHWHDFLIYARGRDDTTSPGEGGEGRVDNGLGSAKSTDILLHYHLGPLNPQTAETVHTRFEAPTLLWVDPRQVSASEALGFTFHPVDEVKYAQEEDALEKFFVAYQSYRDQWGFRGYLNNGDYQRGWSSMWNRWSSGWSCEGWINNELGLDMGWWLMYLRSGQRWYYEAAEDLTRHTMDVDDIHPLDFRDLRSLRGTDYPGRGRLGGCHRHQVLHFGCTSDGDHRFIEGHVLYYYLTGDRRGLDVAREAGEFLFAREEWGGLARNIANHLRGFCVLYEVTGDKNYLEEARKVVEVILRGQLPGGGWGRSYNPAADRWASEFDGWMSSYILRGLLLYHRLTGDERATAAILKAADAYVAGGNLSYGSRGEFIFNLAYAWRLSQNDKYPDWARKRFDGFAGRVRRRAPGSDDRFQPVGDPFEMLMGLGMPALLDALESAARAKGTAVSPPPAERTQDQKSELPSAIAVDCGAEADYEDAAKRKWHADGFLFEGFRWWGQIGKIGNRTKRAEDTVIEGTDTPAIYRTERFDLSGYKFRLNPGKYALRLHFAETSRAITGPGGRLFDVVVEYADKTVTVPDLDVFKEAGGRNKALVKEFKGLEVRGSLAIRFRAKAQSPMISAIEVAPEQ